jgi:hypothetical protein
VITARRAHFVVSRTMIHSERERARALVLLVLLARASIAHLSTELLVLKPQHGHVVLRTHRSSIVRLGSRGADVCRRTPLACAR